MVAGPGSTDVSNASTQNNPVIPVRRTETEDGEQVQHVNIESNLALVIDEASSTVTYVGRAKIGAGLGQAVWQIRKIDTTSGSRTTWADSNDSFDNVWDDRASLIYG